MRTNIDQLASRAAEMLTDLGYRPSTVQRYKTAWNKVKRWCAEQGIEHFDEAQEHQLIKDLGLNQNV